MYSYEDRMRAVELYIQYDLQAEKTACALGYGTARNIQRWYKEYKETGVLHKKITREIFETNSGELIDSTSAIGIVEEDIFGPTLSIDIEAEKFRNYIK